MMGIGKTSAMAQAAKEILSDNDTGPIVPPNWTGVRARSRGHTAGLSPDSGPRPMSASFPKDPIGLFQRAPPFSITLFSPPPHQRSCAPRYAVGSLRSSLHSCVSVLCRGQGDLVEPNLRRKCQSRWPLRTSCHWRKRHVAVSVNLTPS
jgi:hypothetical protein